MNKSSSLKNRRNKKALFQEKTGPLNVVSFSFRESDSTKIEKGASKIQGTPQSKNNENREQQEI